MRYPNTRERKCPDRRLKSHPAVPCLVIASYLMLAVGCQGPTSDGGRPVTEASSVGQTRDPRLLEESDQPASVSDEQRARAYHQTTKYAEEYPVFQFSRRLVHGGYSARFGRTLHSSEGIRYYFDEQHQLMWTNRRFPPY